MKKLLLITTIAFLLLSCSNEKEQLLLNIIQENEFLIKNQSKIAKAKTEWLKDENYFISQMKYAGASEQEIKKLEQEKENKLKQFDIQLQNINKDLDKNQKIIDSLSN